MKTRILSGVALAVIMIPALVFGGWFLYAVNLAIALIGMFELYRVKKIDNTALAYVGYAAAICFYIIMAFNYSELSMFLVVLSVIALMTVYVVTFPKYQTDSVLMAFMGIFYVAVMLSYIYNVRAMEDGIYIVWLIFVAAWGNDTCAYFVGVLFGRHKMAPKLSPKKSVEGGIGGVAGAALIGAIYGFLVSGYMSDTIASPTITFALASGVGALFAIVGDLAASAIKRNYEIKDYGTLIPGHGGIMDRFDSVIFTAPAVYWAVYFITAGNGIF